MVDKDPVDTWAFGRIALAGDSAHPMYPRGSNGAAQSLIDARALADALRSHGDPQQALKAYEAVRVRAAANVVRINREFPPDFINTKVEELVGDKRFENLDSYITQDELRALSENYKRVAGFTLADVVQARGSV
jgi:2-polyprenyl-6-methoxyphenol hydroxylase-like FAD-dependent oxidoreductase